MSHLRRSRRPAGSSDRPRPPLRRRSLSAGWRKGWLYRTLVLLVIAPMGSGTSCQLTGPPGRLPPRAGRRRSGRRPTGRESACRLRRPAHCSRRRRTSAGRLHAASRRPEAEAAVLRSTPAGRATSPWEAFTPPPIWPREVLERRIADVNGSGSVFQPKCKAATWRPQRRRLPPVSANQGGRGSNLARLAVSHL